MTVSISKIPPATSVHPNPLNGMSLKDRIPYLPPVIIPAGFLARVNNGNSLKGRVRSLVPQPLKKIDQ